MLRLRHIAAVFAVLIVSAGAQEALRDLRTPGFRVTLDRGGMLRVWYLDLPLVTGASCQADTNDWQQIVPSRTPKLAIKEAREGDTQTLTVQTEVPGKGTFTTTVELTVSRLRITNDFVITRASECNILYTECFLARDTLADREFKTDNGASGVLKVGASTTYTKGLRRLEVPTELGKLTIAVAESYTVAGKEGGQAWEFRSVCDRKWGAEDRKTFTLMNVHTLPEPQALSGHTEYEFQFEPRADMDARLDAMRSRLVAAREARLAEMAANEQAREARIQKDGGVVLYPTPQRYERLAGEFILSDKVPIVVPDQMSEPESRAPKRLREELAAYRGVKLAIVPESKWTGGAPAIQIGTTTAQKQLSERLPRGRQEAFSLQMTKGHVLLAGTDPAGTWYGVQALLQLPRWRDTTLVMPCVSVDDWPDFKMRAMTLTLGSPSQMDFLRDTLRRVLPRQRVNMVFIGGASLGKVRWPSHPEVAGENAFTPEQIRELADLARANFIEPVPHVQGFGHTGSLAGKRPDLLAPKAAGRAPCFDISRQDVRAYIFDLYADAIEAFQAKGYFHVGFDEAQGLQLICGERTPAEVVAEHITAVDGWLRQRGLRMIMWADMLLDHDTFGTSSAANSKAPHYGNVDTAPALEMIPKDILLANWYYGVATEHPQLAFLQKAGFEVFPTTWYREANNFLFLRNAHQAGATWAAGSSWMYCSAMNPTMMGALLGEYAWTAGRPELEQLNYDELDLFHALLQPPRVSDRPHRQQTIDLAASANRSAVDRLPGDGKGWLDLGVLRDLSALRPGSLTTKTYQRTIEFAVPGDDHGARCVMVHGSKPALAGVPGAATVPVGKRADALAFLHVGTAYDCRATPAGSYEILYEDGSKETFALRNSLQIAGWLKPSGYGSWRTARQQSYCRDTTLGWRGLTLDGRTAELCLTEWRNPKPNVAIREIRLVAPPNEALALFGLTALQAR
jgi:hypothetical protein